MKKHTIHIFIALAITLLFCKRVEYFPDNPIVITKTVLLGHKGSGTTNDGNTLQGCISGLKLLEGIECDIQMSLNRTLWLSHSQYLTKCGMYEEICFSLASDNTINQTDSCLGPEKNYTRLEEVFDFLHTYYPEKFISLDVKAWQPCNLSDINLTKGMNILAQQIIDLTQKYHLNSKVMVESETGDFLYYVKTHTQSIETYLSTNGDFELGMSRALKAGFTGISFKYKFSENITPEHLELLHRKGLKIQLWTVNDPNDLQEAISLKPDFIQTDSLHFKW